MPEQAGSAAPPVFDRSVLHGLFGGDTDLIGSVLRTYGQSMATALVELRLAMDTGALAEAAEVAHRIKGASRMSGAMALGAAAERLEQLASAGDGIAARQCMQQVDDGWGRLREQLGALTSTP